MCLRHQSVNTFLSSAPPPKKNPGSAPATVRSVNHRLRVVPHLSSGIVERAKRERAWKSPHARKATRGGEREKNVIVSPFLAWSDFRSRARVSLALLFLRTNGGLHRCLGQSYRYRFIARNVENTHEKRTVRYKSQLICIYICCQFFFIHTSKITLFSVRALKRNVFWNTCDFVPKFSLFFIIAQSAFGFHFQNEHPF